jgi:putative transposase
MVGESGKLTASPTKERIMGEPPRLSEILLPGEKSIIYFVTLCVNGRSHVLATDQTFDAITNVIGAINKWTVLAGLIMPDHIHFVITPTTDRSLSVGDFSAGFKRLLGKMLPRQEWEWQRGCFDRLLRSDENLYNKWIYIEQNPVRAGLVANVADWPYYLGSIAEQKDSQSPRTSVGEAVSFPSSSSDRKAANCPRFPVGKLAASPTEEGREEREARSFPYKEV